MENKDLIKLVDALALSKTEARFDAKMDFHEWSINGRRLVELASGMNFWVGDWINFGLKSFCKKNDKGRFVPSDAYKLALQETGLEHDTLRNLAWVAVAVPASVRTERLSWAHHREVAALKIAQQRHWLQLAQGKDGAERWSVSQLRLAIRASQQVINDGDEKDPQVMRWAKPAEDLLRYLKQEDNQMPIENWSADRKRAMRTALEPVKQMVDRLWHDQ